MQIELPQLNKVIVFTIPQKGTTLLNVLVSHGIPIGHSCGGEGVCGTCWVFIEGEQIPKQDIVTRTLWVRQFKNKPLEPSQFFACLIKLSSQDMSKTWVVRCASW